MHTHLGKDGLNVIDKDTWLDFVKDRKPSEQLIMPEAVLSTDKTCIYVNNGSFKYTTALPHSRAFEFRGRHDNDAVFHISPMYIREIRDEIGNLLWINDRSEDLGPIHFQRRGEHCGSFKYRGKYMIFIYPEYDLSKITDNILNLEGA